MTTPADLNQHIIETLYSEAITLGDEARNVFDLSGRLDKTTQDEDLARIALSCEALRTTTRMMHVIAWLLNQKAYVAGELSEFQLRRHGRLPAQFNDQNDDQVEFLDGEVRSLVQRTKSFHARIARLDLSWQERFSLQPTAVHRLRERLGQVVAYL